MTPRVPEPVRPSVARLASALSKRSPPSSSQSNEADDEQSLSDDGSAMSPPALEPAYIGQDTRPTGDRELAGFYMYGWAAEVFVVCGIGSFIPVTLEQLARENGVLLADRRTPCKVVRPAAPSSPALSWATASPDAGQCVVYILGLEINTASFAMYTFSVSVLVQALLIVSMSGAADHGRFRKKLLLCFAFVGSVATMLFLPVMPSVYMLGAVLAIIANTCFGASFVLLNSFLPLLVRFHPSVLFAEETEDGSISSQDRSSVNERGSRNGLVDVDASTPLLSSGPTATNAITSLPLSRAATSRALGLSTRISSYGIAIGYVAALLVQTIGILVVIAFNSSNLGLRLVLFIIGAWWFLFTLPTARWLRPRPGPPLHMDASTSKSRTAITYFLYSWKSLGRTVTHARLLKDVLLFLAAWFLLSDSIATVSGTAVLFAKTTLGMSYAMLALINVIATICGVLGAFFWTRLAAFFHLTPMQVILLCIGLFEFIPIYGLLGYLPLIQRLGFLGLQQQWEMYPLGAIYGFVLGGLSSYCRALFGELIPPGYEAAFYALYAITDKGSSVFGPAIVGAITDAYGQIRPAFWFLAALIGLPFPIMVFVDVERGRAEGLALARTLEELAQARDEMQAEDTDYST